MMVARLPYVALDHLLAQHLETAVRLAVHHFGGGVLELGELVVLVDAGLGEVGVHGDAGDEDVFPDVPLEQLGGGLYLARRVAGVVDDHIPVAALERVDLPVAIA